MNFEIDEAVRRP